MDKIDGIGAGRYRFSQLSLYAELATTRERNRLARDIHDTLGHFLTVINVQLEKALAYRDTKPQEADQAISNAKRLASEALRDVRRSVGALRTTEALPDFTLSLKELVERVQSETCTVELHTEGDEESFSKQELQALYRAVQEGLTNTQRHACASHVWIDLRFKEHAAVLVQRDNGRGFDVTSWQRGGPERDSGYGLQGVQERLELVGGSLQVESEPGQGTTLRACSAAWACVTARRRPSMPAKMAGYNGAAITIIGIPLPWQLPSFRRARLDLISSL